MDKYYLDVRTLAEEADRYFTLAGARISAVLARPSPAVCQPSSSGSSSNRRQGSTMCFYNARYGDRAHKCENSCLWKLGN